MNEQIISTELPVVKPCIKCGARDRNKRGECRECGRGRSRRHYEEKRENYAENARKYYEANRERLLESTRKCAKANPDRTLEYQRKYREANRKRTREAVRNWRNANPDKVNIKAQNRRAKIKGNGGKLSTDIVQALLTKQNNKCACCGADLMQAGYHLDHIMPIALGGTNTDDNVQLLTPKCNLSKGAKHPDDWAKEKGIACL